MLNAYKTILTEKTSLTANVFLFRFQLLEPKEINFKSGQYLILKIEDQPRLYSICSSNSIKEYFELVVEIVTGGLGSTYLNNLKVGDSVNFQGPAGMFTLKENNKPKIFLATGTGIAPTKSMITSQKSKVKSQKSYLFWGLKTRKDVYFFDELKKLAQENVNFQFKICLSREKDLAGLDSRYFMLGHVTNGFESVMVSHSQLKQQKLAQPILTDLTDCDYYLCGGRDMVSSMVTFLQEKGTKKENIFFEKF